MHTIMYVVLMLMLLPVRLYVGVHNLFTAITTRDYQSALQNAGVFDSNEAVDQDGMIAAGGVGHHSMLFVKGTTVGEVLNYLEGFLMNTSGDVKVGVDLADLWMDEAPGDCIAKLRKIEEYLSGNYTDSLVYN